MMYQIELEDEDGRWPFLDSSELLASPKEARQVRDRLATNYPEFGFYVIKVRVND